MTDAQAANIEVTVKSILNPGHHKISCGKGTVLSSIRYYGTNRVRYYLDNPDESQVRKGFFEYQDFLSPLEFLHMLPLFGLYLALPKRSYLYNPVTQLYVTSESIAGFSLTKGSDRPLRVFNESPTKREFTLLKCRYPIYADVPVYLRGQHKGIPSAVISCWIGYVRQVLREERRPRLITFGRVGLNGRRRTLSNHPRLRYRLATPQ